MYMKLDILLPIVLLSIMMATLFLHMRYGKRIKSSLGGKEFRMRDAVLMVIGIGAVVTIFAFVPGMAIMILFLGIYCLILFLFAHLVTPRWYLSLIPPALFIVLYLFYWNEILLDLFAVIFAVLISVYLGSLFTWKTTIAFTTLLTTMDIVQVLVTRHMVASAKKMVGLQLPTLIIIPTFPSVGTIILGLGDLFLSGLLAIQTTQRYGKRVGLMSIASMGIGFLLLETVLLNLRPGYFPATLMVISGWLAALGARYLHGLYTSETSHKNSS